MNKEATKDLTVEKKPYLHLFLLALSALIWGASFVPQSLGMDHVGPFTFNGVRMLMGGIALLPVIFLLRRFGITKKVDMAELLAERKLAKIEELPWYDRRPQLYGGVFAGLALFLASNAQQYAIQFTTTGKAGLYLLSIKGGFYIDHGDLFLVICAIFYAVHILILNHYSPFVDGVALSSVQFFIVGFLSLISMYLREVVSWKSLLAAGPSLLYSGLLSSGVGFTLQVIGLQKVPPTQASLISSQESTLSVIFGWLLLNEIMTGRELLGCALMLTGVLISQLAPFKKKGIET